MTTTDEIMGLIVSCGREMYGFAVGGNNYEDFSEDYTELRTAIEALVADANRYRWIKEHCVLGIYQNGNGWHMSIDGIAPDSKRDIDSAVDAAMKESK